MVKEGSAWQRGRVCQGAMFSKGGMCGRVEDIHGRGPCMARGACILLECILVFG